jgi:branched-chain amino acid transport system substrate-binding protein
MRKSFLGTFIVITCLLTFLFPPFVQAKDLVVGVGTALSGAAASSGLALLRAMELATEDIRASGGINVGKESYQIKLVVYDHKYDVREALSVANKLVYRDNAKYIATFGATCVVATNPLMTENKVLHIASAYGGKKATHPGAPYTFRACLEPAQSHPILLPWIAKKYGIKTIALTSTDDETGLVQAEDAEKEANKIGLTITDKSLAPRGTADFTPMLTKMIAKKPQAIDFGSWAGSEGPLICKQVRELGYKGLLIFSYSQSISLFEKVAGEYMDGSLFYSIFAIDPTPLAGRVTKWYQEKYKERIDPIVLRNYDFLLLIRKAMEAAGTLDTTAVRDFLPRVKVEGVFGEARFGGKSYYGTDCQFLAPVPLAMYDGKQKKFVELYRGDMPAGY